MDANRQRYSSRRVVSLFAASATLQPPERTILAILEPHLSEMRMLDLGVGTGRTTSYFAPRVREYLGIDYSPEMIARCRHDHPSYRFLSGDVRTDLADFPSGRFDFVLFSFNGIDELSYDEREHLLHRLRTICRPGGYFSFSSHNIQCLDELATIKFRKNVFKLVTTLVRHPRFMERNRDAFQRAHEASYVVIHDNLYSFGLDLGYIRPRHQIDRLKSAGFADVRVFALSDGRELTTEAEITHNTDFWLYYLCR